MGGAPSTRIDLLPQRVDEGLGRLRRQRTGFLGGGIEEERAVLRDDAVEQVEARETALEIRQFAAGDQDQPAAGRLEGVERLEAGLVDDAVMSQRAVVIGGETDDDHWSSRRSTRRRRTAFPRQRPMTSGWLIRVTAVRGFLHVNVSDARSIRDNEQ